VLHNLDGRGELGWEEGDGEGEGGGGEEDVELVSRLLRRAADVEDWELCKELARFLVALDKSGVTLQKALKAVGLAGDEQDANGAVN
jgi:hypothetical protein